MPEITTTGIYLTLRYYPPNLPQVPAGNAPVWSPALASRKQFARRRYLWQFIDQTDSVA